MKKQGTIQAKKVVEKKKVATKGNPNANKTLLELILAKSTRAQLNEFEKKHNIIRIMNDVTEILQLQTDFGAFTLKEYKMVKEMLGMMLAVIERLIEFPLHGSETYILQRMKQINKIAQKIKNKK